MKSLGHITVTNKADNAEIDIEGVIGVPEWWQFDNPEERVSTYDKFKANLSAIKALKSTNITVNIRSLGGDVGDALLIFDMLSELPATITTRCYGYVASAATIIAQAANKDRRIVSENSLYLIHQASMLAWGNMNEIEDAVDTLKKTDERLANIYASRSGKDISFFVELMAENNGNGKWLSPDEVIDAGLADAITSSSQIVNVSLDSVKAMKLPEVPQDKIIITKPKNMKVKNTWTAILNFFGFDKGKDHEITDEQMEQLDAEMSNLKGKVEDLEKDKQGMTDSHKTEIEEKDADIRAKASEIDTLKAKVGKLEAENAQLKAEPTKTKDREDPSIDNAGKKPNAAAYEEDIKNFKQ